MKFLRAATIVVAAVMLCVSFAPSREVIQENLFLRVSFFASLVLFVPLFFAAVIQFFAGVRRYLGNKQLNALFGAIFCLALSLYSMYSFNGWFFEEIL